MFLNKGIFETFLKIYFKFLSMYLIFYIDCIINILIDNITRSVVPECFNDVNRQFLAEKPWCVAHFFSLFLTNNVVHCF